jgi:hypothetical protein
MSIIENAKIELAAINFGQEYTNVMIEILEKFFDQWDSGGAVHAVAPVLMRCIAGKPLSPLTGADSEWTDPFGDGIMLQNKRCSSVFKDWRDESGELSSHAGQGTLKIHDIDNPAWDGTFPYWTDRAEVASPVMVIETQD